MIKLTDLLELLIVKGLENTRVVVSNISRTTYDGAAGKCPISVFHKAVVHKFKYNTAEDVYFIDVLYES